MALSVLGPGRPPGDPDLEALYAAPAGPWCRANFVVALDGAIEVDGRSGGLGGPDDRRVFSTLRALTDVVLVGSGTARAENYGRARIPDDARRRRVERGQAPNPPIAVVTNRGDLDPRARLFADDRGDPGASRPLVLTTTGIDRANRQALTEVADVVECGAKEVDLGVALAALRDRGLSNVLCEGGPTILTRLLADGLLDELCLTHAPLVAGPGAGLLTSGAPLGEAVETRRTLLLAGDTQLFARYQVTRTA